MNKCNVCGQGIEDRIVHCCACDTIRHQECFDYTGNCSVYGCGSTEYHINGQEVYIGKQSSTLECLVIAPSRPIYLPTPETLTDFIAVYERKRHGLYPRLAWLRACEEINVGDDTTMRILRDAGYALDKIREETPVAPLSTFVGGILGLVYYVIDPSLFVAIAGLTAAGGGMAGVVMQKASQASDREKVIEKYQRKLQRHTNRRLRRLIP